MDKKRIWIIKNWKTYYPNKDSKRRWVFQKEVIENLEDYYNNFPNSGKKSALVKMPTGTGKTAVMAIFSNYIVPTENILIIVPSVALKSQIEYYLNKKHWEKVVYRKPQNIKRSSYFEPTKLKKLFKGDGFNMQKSTPCNYICTHQTLSLLKKQHEEFKLKDKKDALSDFEKLSQIIGLLFVDEGHREPARTWSEIVRGFEKPTILFTATPYRNDLRFFNIDSDFITDISFQDALETYKVIRDVDFESTKKSYVDKNMDINKKVELFVEQFIPFFVSKARNSYLKFPKAIIRCEDEDEIIKVKREINEKFPEYLKNNKLENNPKFDRKLVISIHDQHSSITNCEYNTVQKAIEYENNAMFWIHQYKLTEGIDDENFIVIGFFSPFQNARSLIQQIGRIIRKPQKEYIHQKRTEKVLQKAFIYYDSNTNVKAYWDGYLEYEKIENKKKIYGTDQIVKRILNSFPEYFYFYNKFSKVVSSKFTQDEFFEFIKKDLRISKITNVYYLNQEITSKDLLKELSDKLKGEDIIDIDYKTYKIDGVEIGMFIGWKIKPTDQLSDSIFFDISFVSYSFFIWKNYLFFRGNINLSNYFPNNIFEQIEPQLFSTLLLPSNDELLIKQLSVLNSDPSLRAVRRKIEGGNNLTYIAPNMNDHLHILTTAMGVVDETPRYLGITRSRITDNRGTFISIDEYISWIKEIVSKLENNKSKNNNMWFFNRYALYVEAPENSIPKHILFDLSTFSEKFKTIIEGDSIDEEFNECSTEIDWDESSKIGTFDLTIRKESFDLSIKYQKKKFRILINKTESKKLRDNYNQREDEKESPVSFIKNKGIFRIITEDGLFYTDNHFFNPSIKLWGEDRFENIGLFYSIKELAEVKNEKEIGPEFVYKKDMFQDYTIFSIIDRLKSRKTAFKLFEESKGFENFLPEYLILDDQSNELADFIAFSASEKKVVLIHAKMGTRKKEKTNSAVAFEKVSDQVIKNLRTFDPYNFTANDIHNNWDECWPSNNNKKVKRIRRRKNNIKGDIIQKKLVALLKTDIKKEVWIFYGKGFEKTELLSEFKKEKPKYEIRHLAYSIINCNEAVTQHGARLKIFTQP